MVIRRIDPFQAGKVCGTLYAFLGLIFGLLFAALGGMMTSSLGDGTTGIPFVGGFGMAAIIILPLLYGIIGFIMTIIMAALYNLVAGWVGGLKFDVE